jgi:alcohol dehydrogenase class IV
MLIKMLHIPSKLSQVGVRAEDIPLLAREAVEDLCMMTNPQRYDVEAIEAMYMAAL